MYINSIVQRANVLLSLSVVGLLFHLTVEHQVSAQIVAQQSVRKSNAWIGDININAGPVGSQIALIATGYGVYTTSFGDGTSEEFPSVNVLLVDANPEDYHNRDHVGYYIRQGIQSENIWTCDSVADFFNHATNMTMNQNITDIRGFQWRLVSQTIGFWHGGFRYFRSYIQVTFIIGPRIGEPQSYSPEGDLYHPPDITGELHTWIGAGVLLWCHGDLDCGPIYLQPEPFNKLVGTDGSNCFSFDQLSLIESQWFDGCECASVFPEVLPFLYESPVCYACGPGRVSHVWNVADEDCRQNADLSFKGDTTNTTNLINETNLVNATNDTEHNVTDYTSININQEMPIVSIHLESVTYGGTGMKIGTLTLASNLSHPNTFSNSKERVLQTIVQWAYDLCSEIGPLECRAITWKPRWEFHTDESSIGGTGHAKNATVIIDAWAASSGSFSTAFPPGSSRPRAANSLDGSWTVDGRSFNPVPSDAFSRFSHITFIPGGYISICSTDPVENLYASSCGNLAWEYPIDFSDDEASYNLPSATSECVEHGYFTNNFATSVEPFCVCSWDIMYPVPWYSPRTIFAPGTSENPPSAQLPPRHNQQMCGNCTNGKVRSTEYPHHCAYCIDAAGCNTTNTISAYCKGTYEDYQCVCNTGYDSSSRCNNCSVGLLPSRTTDSEGKGTCVTCEEVLGCFSAGTHPLSANDCSACLCKHGYTGELCNECDFDVDGAFWDSVTQRCVDAENWCGGFGVPVANSSVASCTCSHGYSGERCTEINETACGPVEYAAVQANPDDTNHCICFGHVKKAWWKAGDPKAICDSCERGFLPTNWDAGAAGGCSNDTQNICPGHVDVDKSSVHGRCICQEGWEMDQEESCSVCSHGWCLRETAPGEEVCFPHGELCGGKFVSEVECPGPGDDWNATVPLCQCVPHHKGHPCSGDRCAEGYIADETSVTCLPCPDGCAIDNCRVLYVDATEELEGEDTKNPIGGVTQCVCPPGLSPPKCEECLGNYSPVFNETTGRITECIPIPEGGTSEGYNRSTTRTFPECEDTERRVSNGSCIPCVGVGLNGCGPRGKCATHPLYYTEVCKCDEDNNVFFFDEDRSVCDSCEPNSIFSLSDMACLRCPDCVPGAHCDITTQHGSTMTVCACGGNERIEGATEVPGFVSKRGHCFQVNREWGAYTKAFTNASISLFHTQPTVIREPILSLSRNPAFVLSLLCSLLILWATVAIVLFNLQKFR